MSSRLSSMKDLAGTHYCQFPRPTIISLFSTFWLSVAAMKTSHSRWKGLMTAQSRCWQSKLVNSHHPKHTLFLFVFPSNAAVIPLRYLLMAAGTLPNEILILREFARPRRPNGLKDCFCPEPGGFNRTLEAHAA